MLAPAPREGEGSRLSAYRAAFVLFLLLLAPVAVPAAASQAGPAADAAALAKPASVGTFDVTPTQGGTAGVARGALVSGILATGGAEGEGTIRSFAVAAPLAGGAVGTSTTLFASIHLEGFAPTSQLRGVGTSALTLEGDGVSMTMMDSVNSLLVIQAAATRSEATRVRFDAPPDVTLSKDAAVENVVRVSGAGAGAAQGALILVGNDGQAATSAGSSLTVDSLQRASAVLAAGSQVIFRADTSYASSSSFVAQEAFDAYDRAVVAALARGTLAGEATTDFSAGENLLVNANAFAFASTRTSTAAAQRVTSVLKAQAEAVGTASAQACAATDTRVQATGAAASATGQACARAALLAYNLDYVDVPARTAENVAVYVDGALSERVEAAADVATRANAYWATSVDGRVLVLTSVSAKAHHAHEITIAAVADAHAAAATLAQLDAQQDLTAEVAGGFEMLGTLQSSAGGAGGVIGNFSSFFASEARGSAGVYDVTDIRSSTQIFSKIELAADATADAAASLAYDARAAVAGQATASTRHAGSAVLRMTATVAGETRAVATFTDSVFMTIEAEAQSATTVRFQLAQDVGVRAVGGSGKVLQLDGPAGKVGYLILTRAEGGARAASGFEIDGQNDVRARLLAGDSVVFRSAAEARTRASADVVVEAVASGVLASEASVGFVANAVNAANVDYRSHMHAAIDVATGATHRGAVAFDVAADAAHRAQAAVVNLVADQATLAAREAEDVAVSVDGQAAVAMSSAAQLVASAEARSAQAAYFVAAGLEGQTQVLVMIPSVAAGAASRVLVESRLEEQRRLDAVVDAFGSFTAGYGGAARGDIVSLVARQDAGLLLDYTVSARSDASADQGTVTGVFDVVRLGASILASTGAPSSTALRFQNEQGTIEVFDVSAAVLKLAADARTDAALDLASGVGAEQVGPNVVMLSAPDFAGVVVLVDAAQATTAGAASGTPSTLAIAEGRITAQLEAGAQVIFKAFSGFESQLDAGQRLAQAEAIASGALIGQVIVRTDPVTHVTSATSVNFYPAAASGVVVGSAVSGAARAGATYGGYGAVQAVTQVVSSDKVELVVSSATSAGKSVILSLDRHTVSGLASGDAILLIDGQEVPAAASYADVLRADADKYYLMTAGHEVGLQAVVALSHFSTRTITLESPPAVSVFLWTTIALAGVVVAQAVVPIVKRRRS